MYSNSKALPCEEYLSDHLKGKTSILENKWSSRLFTTQKQRINRCERPPSFSNAQHQPTINNNSKTPSFLVTEIKQSGISSVGDEKAFARIAAMCFNKALPDNPLQIHIPRINCFCYRRGGLCQSRPHMFYLSNPTHNTWRGGLCQSRPHMFYLSNPTHNTLSSSVTFSLRIISRCEQRPLWSQKKKHVDWNIGLIHRWTAIWH